MRVEFIAEGDELTLKFAPDDNDGVYTDNITMSHHSFSIKLPEDVSFEKIHPDHLALVTLLSVHPFISNEIHIPLNVSPRFAASAKLISSYTVFFKEESYIAYQPDSNSVPSLAFSGGADSTAALLLMPKSTKSVFLDRPINKNPIFRKSLYNKSAAYATINHAKNKNYDIENMNSLHTFQEEKVIFTLF